MADSLSPLAGVASPSAALAPPAHEIGLDERQLRGLLREAATRFWQRSALAPQAARNLAALGVLDGPLWRAIDGLRVWLEHEPSTRARALHELATLTDHVPDAQACTFVHACVLLLAARVRGGGAAAELWNELLPRAPDAVLWALALCLDAPLGDRLAEGVPRAVATGRPELTTLLLRLGVLRPGLSAPLAQAIGAIAAPLHSGLARLAQWRCLERCDAAEIERAGLVHAEGGAHSDQGDAEDALWALALADGPRALVLADEQLRRGTVTPAAVAVAAAAASERLAAWWRGQMPDGVGADLRLYAAALLGGARLIEHELDRIDWTEAWQAAALHDAVLLVSGQAVDAALDAERPGAQRRAEVAALLGALPAEPQRLGQLWLADAPAVAIDDAAPLVGAPLRSLLFVEHAARAGGLYADAADFAPIQALAMQGMAAFDASLRALGQGRIPRRARR